MQTVGSAADIWSVGVLTYLLLVGSSPFIDPSTGNLCLEDLLNANYSFELEEFDVISDTAKDFVSQLLQKDPGLRPTASECLKLPWLSQRTSSLNRVEYRLNRLEQYNKLYATSKQNMSDSMLLDINVNVPSQNCSTSLDKSVQHWVEVLSSPNMHKEDSVSDMSSRASSIVCISDSSSDVVLHEGDRRSYLVASEPFPTSITSIDDASDEIQSKLCMIRQDTLTEANVPDDIQLSPEAFDDSFNPLENKAMTKQKATNRVRRKSMQITTPAFASPLRDAYFKIHSGKARFSCQLAGFPYLPPGIHGHRQAIDDLYPPDDVLMEQSQAGAAVAAWYINGCLLSDGPGVELGSGHGGWLWLCLFDLNQEQSGSVVECIVRNRSGKAKTKARLLQADPPKAPGRPGIVEVTDTEALISWAPVDPSTACDLIYRVDAKYAAENGSAEWHQLGFTVDCRYLATELKPNTRYRIRISAGNAYGWGQYGIASSEFKTHTASSGKAISQLSDHDRDYILSWRQSINMYSLSDHPAAVNVEYVKAGSMPPPVSDKTLQQLHCHGGLISDLDVLKEVCVPERVIKRGSFGKLILAKTNPMLTEQSGIDKGELCLPARLLLKLTTVDPANPDIEQTARREAVLFTGLNSSAGGAFAVMDDYFCNIDVSYLFTANRRLLPLGWSVGWVGNDAAKPTFGVSVNQWIPGGCLIDTLCGRTEYNEFAVMRWAEQLLQAIRWLHIKFFAYSHGSICPSHVLVARRTSSLPDIVLAGFGTKSNEPQFTAPEVRIGQPATSSSDLWSIGAFIYLLLTGECPKVNVNKPSTKEDKPKHEKKKTTMKREQTELSAEHVEAKMMIDYQKLKYYSKAGRKFVYNCLQSVPNKRGTVDYWLESRWFDIHNDHVQKLSKSVILSSQLQSYRDNQVAQCDYFEQTDPTDLQIP